MNGQIDKKKVEYSTGQKISSRKVSDPESGSFSEFLPAARDHHSKEVKPKTLVLHTGFNHIRRRFYGRNITTDQENYYRQETVNNTTNIFDAATCGFKASNALQKVLIMNLPVDEKKSWTFKASFALLFNKTIANLWIKSPFKDSISICNSSFSKDKVTDVLLKLLFKPYEKNNKQEYGQWTLVKSKNKKQKFT